MSKETIIEIKKTEERASEIRAEAQQKAKAMIDEAEKEGKKLCDKTESSVSRELANKLAKMRAVSDKKIALASEEAKTESEELARQAKNRMRGAVQLIIWGIVEKCQ